MKLKDYFLKSLKYLSLVAMTIFCLLPIVVIVFAAFKTKVEFATTSPLAMPHNWLNFSNFVIAFTRGDMGLAFMNTLFVFAVSIIGSIFLGTTLAYALHRFDFKGRKLIMGLYLFISIVPMVTAQVATFRIINAIGLFNTRSALILLYTGTDALSVYIYYQFLENIPKSLDEAAIVDGASTWTIYWKIILPLLTPAIATNVILKGIGIYNDFYLPFLYAPNPNLKVISTSLFAFKGPFGSAWEIISAGVVIVLIPTVLAFAFLQKQIYSGFSGGGVKE